MASLISVTDFRETGSTIGASYCKKHEGANDFVILTRIVMPLSMPIIAVLIMYYAAGH